MVNLVFDPKKPKKASSVQYDDSETQEKLNNIQEAANNPQADVNAKNQIKVLKEDDKWVLKRGRYPKPFARYAKKSLAVDEAKKFIKSEQCDVIIYKVDGSILKSYIYEHQKEA